MAIIHPSLPSDGDEAIVEPYNDAINTILGVVNGGIDSDNVSAASLPWSVMQTQTNVIPAAAMQDNGNLITSRKENSFDHVVSGGVWTADAAASTLKGSMTAMTVQIDGQRILISAITAHTFTASKDTYIDVLDNGNGTGTVGYSEVSNNAASPSLASSSMRLAIVVSGSASIADAAHINQGQEIALVPIASSTPYAVTDSLGNLICPRDPSRRLLGYRQITGATTLTAPTSAALLTGLTVPVIIPTGRKIKITLDYGLNISGTSGTFSGDICLTSAGDSNRLKQGNYTASVAYAGTLVYVTSALSSSQVFVGCGRAASGNVTVNADTLAPSFVMVELI